MASIEERARAKINLELRILGRRADGYHELDSLVVFAQASDRLTFGEHDDLRLEISGPFAAALADAPDNLVLRAARRLAALAARPPAALIHLAKHLPVAAGLGGGSADAAAALRGLHRLWRLDLPLADLMPLAAGLGADVPVCLTGRPARMRGIGERVEELPGLPGLALLLVSPNRPLATAAVFAGLGQIDPAPAERAPPPGDRAPLLAWLGASRNDLEAPARRLEPAIGDVLAALTVQPGCELARMSGSGAACFGIFPNVEQARAAATALRLAHPDWWVAASRTEGS
jgi:4-diphosphocytidyl-2-C-methyl-D-erythritol kinase